MRKSVGSALLTFVVLAMLAGRMSLFIFPATSTASVALSRDTIVHTEISPERSSGFSITTTIIPENASSSSRIVWHATHGRVTINGYALSLIGSELIFEAGDGEQSIAAHTPIDTTDSRIDIAAVFSHPAGTAEGVIDLFIGGKKVASASGPIGVIDAAGELAIGSESFGEKEFPGTISNTILYPRALSGTEITLPYILR